MRRDTITRLLKRLSISKADKPSASGAPASQIADHSNEANFSDADADADADTTPFLFALPVELQMTIITDLCFSDLCALRLTCRRAANNLLSGSEILTHWLHNNSTTATHISSLQRLLHPPSSSSSPPEVTFAYLLEQHHRLHIAQQLSLCLERYVHFRVGPHLTLRRPTTSPEDTRERLIRPLLVLQHYLEHLSHIWLNLPIEPIPPPKSFNEVFDVHERRIFSAYPLPDFMDAHKTWLFLLWTVNQLLVKPPSPSTVRSLDDEFYREHWTRSPISDDDFRTYILFTNIHGVLALLRMPTYRERRKAIGAVTASLDPGRNIYKWRESWKSVSLRLRDSGPVELQVQGALVMQQRCRINAIWTKPARQILLDKDMLGSWRDFIVPVGTAWQTIVFLRDVCRYEFMPGWSLGEEVVSEQASPE